MDLIFTFETILYLLLKLPNVDLRLPNLTRIFI